MIRILTFLVDNQLLRSIQDAAPYQFIKFVQLRVARSRSISFSWNSLSQHWIWKFLCFLSRTNGFLIRKAFFLIWSKNFTNCAIMHCFFSKTKVLRWALLLMMRESVGWWRFLLISVKMLRSSHSKLFRIIC